MPDSGCTRTKLDEFVFQGITLAFELRSRFTVIARVDDTRVQEYPNLSAFEIQQLLERFIKPYLTSERRVASACKITTEHGYMVVLVIVQGANTAYVSFEMNRP